MHRPDNTSAHCDGLARTERGRYADAARRDRWHSWAVRQEEHRPRSSTTYLPAPVSVGQRRPVSVPHEEGHVPMQGTSECRCRTAPWIHIGMLTPKPSPGLYYCPEKQHCLHGTRLHDGRVADHWRNVPGECPWVGMRVTDEPTCRCGRGPWINLQYIRICTRRNLTGPLVSVRCPGWCPCRLVAVADGRLEEHLRDSRTLCPWSGTRLIPIGLPPPLFPPAHRS